MGVESRRGLASRDNILVVSVQTKIHLPSGSRRSAALGIFCWGDRIEIWARVVDGDAAEIKFTNCWIT